MPRRKILKKKFPFPDPIFNNYLVGMLITKLTKKGRKFIALAIVYEMLDIITYRFQMDPIQTFESAIKNVTPKVEVKPRRLGGTIYEVPVEVNTFRGTNLALKWIVKAAKTRSGKHMSVQLANEIIDASNNIGGAIRKKQETHKRAQANKAFAHFRY